MFHLLGSILQRQRQRSLAATVVLAALATLVLHLVAGMSLAPALYETLRVFVLEANTEVGHDAPASLRLSLWAMRFVAPVLTAGLAAELVHGLGLFHLPTLYLLLGIFPRQHVIIGGLGRLGRHVAQRLARAGMPVVVIERDAENDFIAEVRRMGVPVILGDAADPATLRHAGLRHCAHLVSVTSRDLVNLDVALVGLACRRASDLAGFTAWAHVADPSIAEHIPQNLATGVGEHFRVLDTYAAAADALVRTRLPATFSGDVFVVAGLGRFGTSVLRECLRAHAAHAGSSFVAIDNTADAPRRARARGCGADTERVQFIIADMLDDSVATALSAHLAGGRRLHFLVCTDDDERNLQFALAIRTRLGDRDEVRVITRMFQSLRSRGDTLLLRGVEAVEFVDLLEEFWPAEMAKSLAPRVDRRWEVTAAAIIKPETSSARQRFRG